MTGNINRYPNKQRLLKFIVKAQIPVIVLVNRQLDTILHFQVRLEVKFDYKPKNVRDLLCHK